MCDCVAIVIFCDGHSSQLFHRICCLLWGQSWKTCLSNTYCGGEKAARLELLQTHGAGVGPKEQNEGHQGDVRHIATGLSDQTSSVLQTLLPGQGCPGGIHWLDKEFPLLFDQLNNFIPWH